MRARRDYRAARLSLIRRRLRAARIQLESARKLARLSKTGEGWSRWMRACKFWKQRIRFWIHEAEAELYGPEGPPWRK